MENRYLDNMICPLINELIDAGECIENQDIVDMFVKDIHLPLKYKEKENWREICKNCKYHNQE